MQRNQFANLGLWDRAHRMRSEWEDHGEHFLLLAEKAYQGRSEQSKITQKINLRSWSRHRQWTGHRDGVFAEKPAFDF